MIYIKMKPVLKWIPMQANHLLLFVFVVALFCIAGCLKEKQPEETNNFILIDKSFHLAYICDRMPTNLICYYGFINTSGKWVIKPQYEDAQYYSEGLAPVKKDNKWGFIDQTGQFAIEPRFDELPYGFSQGLARIKIQNGLQYIDRAGNAAFNTMFDSANPFNQDRAFIRMKSDEKWSIINRKGEVLVSNRFDGCDGQFSSNGMAVVRIGNYYGFVNLDGKFVIDPKYRNAKNFSEGLSLVAGGEHGESGFIDEKGNVVINFQYAEAQSFSEGLAAVRVRNKWGYINVNGEMVIQPQFLVSQHISSVVRPFSEGLACVVVEGKYGYINKSGNIVIKPEYSWAIPFRNGLAMVSREKIAKNDLEFLTAYVNKQGKTVWEHQGQPLTIDISMYRVGKPWGLPL